MGLRRALRVVASRWWLVVLVGLLGAVGGVGVVRWSNQSIEAAYRAAAPVAFLALGEESDAAFQARLQTAQTRAEGVLTTQLLADSRLAVEIDADQGRLEFVATTGDIAEARRVAGDLRAAYLSAEPASGVVEQYQAVLTDLETRILALRSQLADLTPGEAPPPNPDVDARSSLLSSQLSTLRQRAASISLQLAYPELAEPGADPEALAVELAALRDLITRISADLAAIQPADAVTQTTEPTVNLESLVIEQRLRNFESQYVETSLRLLELTDTEGVGDEVLASNVTRPERSELQAGALGLIAGLVLAAGAAFGSDRIRRPVLGPDDELPLAVLGTVQRARPTSRAASPWYPRSTGTPRRRDVQALRAALDASIGESAVTVGMVGVGASNAEVQALVADLAASIAASGRTALVLDANLESPSTLPEFGSEPPDLADILTYRDGAEDLRSQVKKALVERNEVLPDLIGLRAGAGVTDPVDALAGRQFRELMAAVESVVDVTIVAAPGWGDPATDALVQRLGFTALVGRLRKATAPTIEAITHELRDRQVSCGGLVLLTGRPARRPLFRWARSDGTHRRRSHGESESQAGGEVTTGVGEGFVSRPRKRRRRRRTLLEDVSAEVHLRSLVFRMLTDRHLEHAPIQIIGPQTRPAAADHLLEMMSQEAPKRPKTLDDELEELLGCVPGRDGRMASRAALDLWLVNAFRRPGDRAQVAHVASPRAELQAIVFLPSFDEELIAELRRHVQFHLRSARAEIVATQGSEDGKQRGHVKRYVDLEEFDRRLEMMKQNLQEERMSVSLLRRSGLLANEEGGS